MPHLIVNSLPMPGYYGAPNGLSKDPATGHLVKEGVSADYRIRDINAYRANYSKKIQYKSESWEGERHNPDKAVCASQLRSLFETVDWTAGTLYGTVSYGCYWDGAYSSYCHDEGNATVHAMVWTLPSISATYPYMKKVGFSITSLTAPAGTGTPRVACFPSSSRTADLPLTYAALAALPYAEISEAGWNELDLRAQKWKTADYAYLTLIAYFADLQPPDITDDYCLSDTATIRLGGYSSTTTPVLTCGN